MSLEAECVLVVEDDADLREALVGILEDEGYHVGSASHGQEAFDRLHAGCRPCIILLDLMMPVMDGWTFCREMDKDASLSGIPVIVVSAVTRNDPRNECVNAVDHLSKPVDVGRLLAAITQRC
jgi:CheY-like chemotaxis protein